MSQPKKELQRVETVAALRAQVSAWRARGERIALTPTMGALHEGHLSLVRLGLERADRVVATIFVNPKQFGPNEDFAAYPRDGERDSRLLAEAGCDLLFAPSVDAMYPPGFATSVRVRGVSEPLCGAVRSGHFDGVAVVVAKLLLQAQADVAVFGEKDWQQLTVIRRLAQDLDVPTEIVGAPIVREADGLAMSSRNRYLDPEQRAAASALKVELDKAASAIRDGVCAATACAAARAAVIDAGFRSVDYFEARDAESLEPLDSSPPTRPTRVFAAALLGRARLIDNVPV
ncbi:MAG: pantoate--beta-alanine ligase [Neomegalonema sp.]|nr:pantoate--beta-alanine ligase [Neomegalonema sp.]